MFVTITDDEFWKGPLARRRPLKRDYLADLVEAVAAAHPRVIALDFEFRAPLQEGQASYHDYDKETELLLAAIDKAALDVPVILPKTLRPVTGQDIEKFHREHPNEQVDELPEYVAEPDIFTNHDFTNSTGREQSGTPKIYEGYIQFAYDLRQIPARVPLLSRKPMDSFSFAIVAAAYYDLYTSLVGDDRDERGITLEFGSFLPVEKFAERSIPAEAVRKFAQGKKKEDEARHTKAASKRARLLAEASVLKHEAKPYLDKLQSQIVIMCGAWHEDAYNEGAWIDQHYTPAGYISGAFVHANYAEALRRGRHFPAIPDWLVDVFEVLSVVIAAIVVNSGSRRLYKIIATLLPLFVFAVLGYFFAQNLGVFFEAFLPISVIAGHMVFDKILDWRELAQKAEADARAVPVSATGADSVQQKHT